MSKALVTGITGNIGRAVSAQLLIEGWHVTGIARTVPEHYEGVYLSELVALDLTDYEGVNQFCLGQDGPFDLVVITHGNQYGITVGSEGFIEHYRRVLDGNLNSAVALTDGLISNKLLNPGSLIIYFSSIQATQPRGGRGPYAIAKSGLEGLARIVAVEQGPDIRAIALRLGQMSEPMKGIKFTQEQLTAIQSRTVLPWPTPTQVAEFCLALYDQPGMSGNVIDLDSSHNLRVWP